MRCYQKIQELELCTAGIVTIIMQIPHCGCVIMYDFAGQAEYYSSHAAICKNPMTSHGYLIIVVFNQNKDINDCVQFWQLINCL